MKINSKDINRLIITSLYDFLSVDSSLINDDISERCLCGRLAISFERRLRYFGFNGYYADVEYNRKQDGKLKSIIDEQYVVTNITTDLIIHSRGKFIKNDNLIAIEMAKPNKSSIEFQKDRKRLRILTKCDDIWPYGSDVHPEHVCGYRRGLYIIVDRNNQLIIIEQYINGERKVPDMLISLDIMKNTPIFPDNYIRYIKIMAYLLHQRELTKDDIRVPY